MNAPISLFVAGTDTKIGKTLVSAAFLRSLARANLHTAGMKPIAAGAFERDGEWCNEDTDQADGAASAQLPSGIRTQLQLKEPTAPLIAAARQNVSLDSAASPLLRSLRTSQTSH